MSILHGKPTNVQFTRTKKLNDATARHNTQVRVQKEVTRATTKISSELLVFAIKRQAAGAKGETWMKELGNEYNRLMGQELVQERLGSNVVSVDAGPFLAGIISGADKLLGPSKIAAAVAKRDAATVADVAAKMSAANAVTLGLVVQEVVDKTTRSVTETTAKAVAQAVYDFVVTPAIAPAETPAPKPPTQTVKTIRNAANRAVGVLVIQSRKVKAAHQISWKSDGRNLKIDGTLPVELPAGTTVASATKLLLELSAGIVEPTKPSFIVSRSHPDGDEVLI